MGTHCVFSSHGILTATRHEETILGAQNRLKHTKAAQPDCDYYVSIENGVVEVAVSGELRYYDLAWVIMEERGGGCSMAHSVGVEFDRSDVEAARRCPALQVWR